MSRCSKLILSCCLVLESIFWAGPIFAADQEQDQSLFSNYEIRVIRPRYFTKRGHWELGLQASMIMNNTFVYTLMVSGLITYHFTEAWAFELAVAVGTSIDRSEKTLLFSDFDIKTQIFRTLYTIEGSILYTPAYGKLQLPSGQLVYYDTYVGLGGGVTGVEWDYTDFCFDKSNQGIAMKSNSTGAYPGVVASFGQRIFYTKTKAIKWDIRWHESYFNTADTNCYTTDSTSGGMSSHDNVTLQLGASQFF